MIFDTLDHVERYKGISKWLDIAIEFLMGRDLKQLPLGKTEIFEDKVFANVMDARTVEETETAFEIHKKYMDIQIDIEGTEIVQIGFEEKGEASPYDEASDFGTVICEKNNSCVLGPGKFIICMGREPHKPTLVASDNRKVRKCVIKVAL